MSSTRPRVLAALLALAGCGGGDGGPGDQDGGPGDEHGGGLSPDAGTPEVGATDPVVPAGCTDTPTLCAGDGATDDRACLQELIDGAAGGTAFLAGGRTYALGGALVLPAFTSLEACGASLTVTAPAVLLEVAGDGVSIHDAHLVYGADAPLGGVIDLAPGVGDLTVDSCHVDAGVAIASVRIDDVDVAGVTLSNNRIHGGRHGFLVSSLGVPAEAPERRPRDLRIDRNSFADQRHAAVTLGGATVAVVADNEILRGAGNFVRLEGGARGVALRGNRMRGPLGDPDVGGSGVLLSEVEDVAIVDNTVEDAVGHGIELSWSDEASNRDVTIAGNRIRGAGGFGILVGSADPTPIDVEIGPATVDGVAYGGNSALGCAAGPIEVAPGTTGVTVDGNVDF